MAADFPRPCQQLPAEWLPSPPPWQLCGPNPCAFEAAGLGEGKTRLGQCVPGQGQVRCSCKHHPYPTRTTVPASTALTPPPYPTRPFLTELLPRQDQGDSRVCDSYCHECDLNEPFKSACCVLRCLCVVVCLCAGVQRLRGPGQPEHDHAVQQRVHAPVDQPGDRHCCHPGLCRCILLVLGFMGVASWRECWWAVHGSSGRTRTPRST